MYLSDGIIGKTYKILRFQNLPLTIERRLESLGMTPGTALDVLNNKSHGTAIIRVRESRYAVGSAITSCVVVKEVPGPTIAQVVSNNASSAKSQDRGEAHGE